MCKGLVERLRAALGADALLKGEQLRARPVSGRVPPGRGRSPSRSNGSTGSGAGRRHRHRHGGGRSDDPGGAIATNAGGNKVIRYGMTRDLVLGLEAVLADGTVVSSMNGLLKSNTGLDLKQLFIGTEGTLGVVTRAVLRLHPLPHGRHTALAALPDFAAMAGFLRAMREESNGTLSSFEAMWSAYYGLMADAVVARSEAERTALWAIRDEVSEHLRPLAPGFTYDVSLHIVLADGAGPDGDDQARARPLGPPQPRKAAVRRGEFRDVLHGFNP